MKKSLRKKLLIGTLALAIVATGTTGILTKGFKTWGPDIVENNHSEQVDADGIVSHGITMVKMAANQTNYGSTSFWYSINPNINTDHVLYKLTYKDGSAVDTSILTITLNEESKIVSVKCNAPFMKQITLTLYVQSNESINASVTLDFREKLTVNQTMSITEGKPLNFTTIVDTTGGSITADKTVKNASIKWNPQFVSELKADLKNTYESIEYSSPQNTNYYENSVTIYGLDDTSLSKWTTGNFTYQAFAESIKLVGDYDWIYSDDDGDPSNYIATYYVTDLGLTKFKSYFSGEKAIFDYSATVNNYNYTKSFGLKIDSLNITSLTINSIPSYIF